MSAAASPQGGIGRETASAPPPPTPSASAEGALTTEEQVDRLSHQGAIMFCKELIDERRGLLDELAIERKARRVADRKLRLAELQHGFSSGAAKRENYSLGEVSSSSSSGSEKLADCTYGASFEASLVGFAAHPKEGEVCREVMASLLKGGKITAEEPQERNECYPSVKRAVRAVAKACERRGLPVLRAFYRASADPSADSRTRDFAFTMPNEHRLLSPNTCFLLGVKGTHRASDELSRDELLREGVAHAIRALMERQNACEDLLDCGIACVALGAVGLIVVRIDFRDDRIPVTLSRELPLLPSEGSDTIPEGLRALVRLMLCATDVAPFGLKPVEFVPAPPYRRVSLLGSGGFGTIAEVVAEGSTKTMVCKWIRHADQKADLHLERAVLEDLAGEPAVPFVPRVCGVTTDSKGEGEALLLSPVGVPFEDALFCRDSEEVPLGSDTRMQQAAKALSQLWAALSAAHAKGYVHCDVRPSNIVFVDADSADEGPSACLIDWGLAKRLGQEYDSSKLMGVLQFFSERQLLLLSSRADKWKPAGADDLEAAVLTFFTTALTTSGRSPWEQFVLSPSDVLDDRAVWISENADELRRAIGFIPEAASGARDMALSLIDASIKRDVK